MTALTAWRRCKTRIQQALPSFYAGARLLKKTLDLRQQLPFTFGLPTEYHFLMTNFCNARCLFCNQRPGKGSRDEISFGSFSRMLTHIPPGSARSFCMSGGGEPLLAQDLWRIIELVNTQRPKIQIRIRTNGFLIKEHAARLSAARIARLEVSVHGTGETNNEVTGRTDSEEIFEGIHELNRLDAQRGKKTPILFCPVVSNRTIGNIPALLEKAGSLGVEEFTVEFTRYFDYLRENAGRRLDPLDSLYYHQQRYRQIITAARARAAQLNIAFGAALFGEPGALPWCRQPWTVVVVDWKGNVYPCTGGEEWFRRKVESGQYRFGNLAEEDVRAFWNNRLYRRLRKTCSPRFKKRLIPECENCPMSICLKGPDAESRHIIKTS